MGSSASHEPRSAERQAHGKNAVIEKLQNMVRVGNTIVSYAVVPQLIGEENEARQKKRGGVLTVGLLSMARDTVLKTKAMVLDPGYQELFNTVVDETAHLFILLELSGKYGRRYGRLEFCQEGWELEVGTSVADVDVAGSCAGCGWTTPAKGKTVSTVVAAIESLPTEYHVLYNNCRTTAKAVVSMLGGNSTALISSLISSK